MAVIRKPQVNTITAELNTPPDGTGTIEFEAWYDLAQVDITSTKTATLAAMGLSYAAGVFTTLRAGVWNLGWTWFIEAAPGGACSLQVDTGTFDTPANTTAVANPNTLGTIWGTRTIALPAAATFWWRQTCTNGTDVPLTYMNAVVTRVV